MANRKVVKIASIIFLLVSSTISGVYFLKNFNGLYKPMNPVVYFEIPVSDMNRAINFYSSVFGFDFTKDNIHGNEMAFFPLNPSLQGITGGLAKGEIYKPTKEGVLIYFFTQDIDQTLAKVLELGGSVLFPKTRAGEYGFVAEFQDSEGNRIGLSQK